MRGNKCESAKCKVGIAKIPWSAWVLEGSGVLATISLTLFRSISQYESDRLYGFATFGQKIDWMRFKPASMRSVGLSAQQ